MPPNLQTAVFELLSEKPTDFGKNCDLSKIEITQANNVTYVITEDGPSQTTLMEISDCELDPINIKVCARKVEDTTRQMVFRGWRFILICAVIKQMMPPGYNFEFEQYGSDYEYFFVWNTENTDSPSRDYYYYIEWRNPLCLYFSREVYNDLEDDATPRRDGVDLDTLDLAFRSCKSFMPQWRFES